MNKITIWIHVKVVHLIRDPRAVLSSRATAHWDVYSLQAAQLCQQMLGDMALAKVLPPERCKAGNKEGNPQKYCLRYTLVRYEDLVDNTEEMVKSLYGRLGLRWTEEIR